MFRRHLGFQYIDLSWLPADIDGVPEGCRLLYQFIVIFFGIRVRRANHSEDRSLLNQFPPLIEEGVTVDGLIVVIEQIHLGLRIHPALATGNAPGPPD